MRTTWVVLLVAACTEPAFLARPLPPLAPPAPAARELVAPGLDLEPGEHFIWEVHARGMTIGRVEVAVEDDLVTSRFRTGALIAAFTTIEHDLSTRLDRTKARPIAATERVEYEGKNRQFSTDFTGTTAHSFHSALGALRAWARPEARPGFLNVLHADKMFRFELLQPVVQGDLLRVDAKVIGPDTDPIAITMWLDVSRIPMRIEIRDGDDRVTAELIGA
jgi:hypothetical protein